MCLCVCLCRSDHHGAAVQHPAVPGRRLSDCLYVCVCRSDHHGAAVQHPAVPGRRLSDCLYVCVCRSDHHGAAVQHPAIPGRRLSDCLTVCMSVCVGQTTTERLYNILLFPDGGWMADRPSPPPCPAVDGAGEPQRQRELAQLRRLYVPQTVCVLHTVLTESGRLQEAARLADLVAGDQYQLYKVRITWPETCNHIDVTLL